MKVLFVIGLIVLILGIAAFVVPLPRYDHEGFRAGKFQATLETRHDEKLSPAVGGMMVLAGAAMMIFGRR